jgi:xanthine/CO dehydrogenase XdhC/CoxF family maturation factor
VGLWAAGKVGARCVTYAREILKAGRREHELVTWNLHCDIGMTCGGEVTYLFDVQTGQGELASKNGNTCRGFVELATRTAQHLRVEAPFAMAKLRASTNPVRVPVALMIALMVFGAPYL